MSCQFANKLNNMNKLFQVSFYFLLCVTEVLWSLLTGQPPSCQQIYQDNITIVKDKRNSHVKIGGIFIDKLALIPPLLVCVISNCGL